MISTNFQGQARFSSPADAMAAWGLKNRDLRFVRHEIRTLLFKYINQGDAVVQFQ
jgi:hypothetical protein